MGPAATSASRSRPKLCRNGGIGGLDIRVRGRGSRLWLGGAEPLATQSRPTTVEGIRTPGMPSTTVLLATICGLLLMVVPSLISAPLPLVLAGMAVMALPFLLRS